MQFIIGGMETLSFFKNVLLAVDLSKNSVPPLKKALSLHHSGAKLSCLYVVPEEGDENRSFRKFFNAEGAEDSVLENYALPWLDNWADKVETTIPDDVKLRARVGEPYEEILSEAEEGEYDLIVIGTHGRSGLERFWIGSVAEEVVRRANQPVLTVRSRTPNPDLIVEG